MQHLEGSGRPVLYIGRKILEGLSELQPVASHCTSYKIPDARKCVYKGALAGGFVVSIGSFNWLLA
jgi:hypothetical protein